MRRRGLVIGAAVVLLVAVVVGLGSQLRREFFPEVDAGAFEMYVRGAIGHAHRGHRKADRRGRKS